MFKRTVTGAIYVVLLTAFFLLREFVDSRLFHLLTCFLLIAGTIEVANAVKDFIPKLFKILSIIEASIMLPVYLLVEHFLPANGGIALLILMLLFLNFTVFYSLCDKTPFERTLPRLLPLIYPSLLLLFMILANQDKNGFIILLLSFVISPLSDTFAYLVGSMIGGKKLCPKLSPKKTWSGAIGGTVGGALGALIVYLIFKPTINFFSPILFFVLIGVFASIVNIFGDLFESYIKRRVGIKDMGKLLPGHGGVMDRIDGTSFVVIFIYLAFLFV